MTQYTGGKVHKRVAALAMNMRGGGGFEIWQYASRKPEPAEFKVGLSDIGLLNVKMKTPDAVEAAAQFKKMGVNVLCEPSLNPAGQRHFWVADPAGNWFDVVESEAWFKKNDSLTGGALGATIGVSDMEKSMAFYKDMLGFDQVLSDETGRFEDFPELPDHRLKFRRVLLTQSHQSIGPFTPLLGPNEIELLQCIDKRGRKIFADRYWGDLGFIHLCFDVRGMDDLKHRGTELGYPFTVDSADSFDMGKAAGRFSYVEDPDGTLIEFVETHKLPIVEKWGWYIDLRKRNQEKSLPRWLLGFFRFNRVKD